MNEVKQKQEEKPNRKGPTKWRISTFIVDLDLNIIKTLNINFCTS